MFLAKPDSKYKISYLSALEEVSRDEINRTNLAAPSVNQSFENFVNKLNDQSKGKNLPIGYVPATTFWLIDSDEFIGRVQIRHKLNEYLLNQGGHIGYYIRPSKRRIG